MTLNREANKEVRVDYVTVDGTAVAGRDYEPKSGTLVFGRRDLTKTIWMPVEFDAAYEDTETMTLRLSNPRGGQIEDGTATGSIYDYSTSTLTMHIVGIRGYSDRLLGPVHTIAMH